MLKQPSSLALCGIAVLLSFPPIARSAVQPVRYDNHKLVSVTLKSPADIETMLRISQDPWSEQVGTGNVLFRVPPDRMDDLRSSGLAFDIRHENIQELIERQRPPADKQLDSWFDDFKRVEEVYAYLDSLVALRPDLVTKLDIGFTIEGRMIHGMRITATDDPENAPAILFNGCQHAREWITPMTTMYIADQLVRSYDTDMQVHALLDQLIFYVVPIVNLDGHAYSWDTERLWRKNRRDNGDGTFGVDLNRNWGFNWGDDASSSGDPGNILYRGTSPFSEPETQALRNFILARPSILAHIDFHSYGQILISPYGEVAGQPPEPDRTSFDNLNTAMSAAIFDVNGVVYEPAPSGGYLSGGLACWSHASKGILSWTFEVRDTGTYGFLLPAIQILPTAEENYAAIKVLAEFVAQPFEFRFPLGLPSRIAPDALTTIPIDIVEISQVLDTTSARMIVRPEADSAMFEVGLGYLGGSNFEVTLPLGTCGSPMDYYFLARSDIGRMIQSPEFAPSTIYSTSVYNETTLLFDDMETDNGWNVGDIDDDATTGIWTRVDPIGTAAQPEDDFSPDGNICWVTGQGTIGGELGENDVDGGKTTLFSPVFDIAGADALIRYARWYSNDTGNAPNADTFVVDISNDGGGTWTNVETVGPYGPQTHGGWFEHEFVVGDFVKPTAQIMLRFVASDESDGSLVEAAIDDLSMHTLSCPPHALDVTPAGSRYLRIVPPSGTVPVALGVTSTEFPCLDRYVDQDGHLVDTPIFQSPSQWAVTYVHGSEILPETPYTIRVETSGGAVIEQIAQETGRWGDAVSSYAGGWLPGDGAVDVLDLTAGLDRFRNLTLAPIMPWCDTYPTDPDGIITILDITHTLDAFQGMGYPFAVPCQ